MATAQPRMHAREERGILPASIIRRLYELGCRTEVRADTPRDHDLNAPPLRRSDSR